MGNGYKDTWEIYSTFVSLEDGQGEGEVWSIHQDHPT
jgi:hypothetical protein